MGVLPGGMDLGRPLFNRFARNSEGKRDQIWRGALTFALPYEVSNKGKLII